MKNKPIIIVAGEIKSIFFEIFFKAIKKIKIRSPLIVVSCVKEYAFSSKKFRSNYKFKLIKPSQINSITNKRFIYVININHKKNNNKLIQFKNNREYVLKCFNVAFELLKKGVSKKFLNGPINKKNTLNNSFLGITEMVSKNFKKKILEC